MMGPSTPPMGARKGLKKGKYVRPQTKIARQLIKRPNKKGKNKKGGLESELRSLKNEKELNRVSFSKKKGGGKRKKKNRRLNKTCQA